MANALYTRMKASASGMLSRLGAPATIQTTSGETLKGFGVFLNSVEKDVPGTTITNATKTVYYQGSDKVYPGPGDYITLKGETWAINIAQPIQPDGSTVILFKLQVTQ